MAKFDFDSLIEVCIFIPKYLTLMKKNILLFIFAMYLGNVLAQITVTSATFPEAGDTLRMAVDNNPNIEIQAAGENLTWDFSSLDGPIFENLILDANQGSAADTYPNATILTGQFPLPERYFETTDTKYTGLGYSGQDPVGIGLDVVFKNEPALVERLSPLNYTDENNSTSFVRVPYAWDDLPSIVTDSLAAGFQITPDSIAIEVETVREDEVDAWGNVILPGGNFDVLRVRRWDVTDTKVKAYFPFLEWVDVTDALSDFSPLLGQDTTLTYRYYNDTSKEPIAIIRVDAVDESLKNAQYKSIDLSTGVIKLYEKQPNIYAYPNPAINTIRFDVVNLPKGYYDLKIYNILGIEVWSHEYKFQNINDTIQLDVSHFKKGTYLYSLADENGKTLITRRLIILRP